jgi:hypothetical protein
MVFNLEIVFNSFFFLINFFQSIFNIYYLELDEENLDKNIENDVNKKDNN